MLHLNFPFAILMALPTTSPRRFTGTALAYCLPGSVRVKAPDFPACSQRRKTVPLPSGFSPKAVIKTPGSETAIPLLFNGNLPGAPSASPVNSGKRVSQPFLTRLLTVSEPLPIGQTRTFSVQLPPCHKAKLVFHMLLYKFTNTAGWVGT
ncbi:hypothetical protein D3C73_1029870 [compost metagenome]